MKTNDMIGLGVLGLLAFLYFQSRKTAPPVTTPALDEPAPTPVITYQKFQPVMEVEKQQSRVAGYFPSKLPGARPDMSYGVRWGDGRKYIDTSRQAKRVL